MPGSKVKSPCAPSWGARATLLIFALTCTVESYASACKTYVTADATRVESVLDTNYKRLKTLFPRFVIVFEQDKVIFKINKYADQEIGRLIYIVNGTDLEILYNWTSESYRELGIATVLLGEVLRLYPEVEQISTATLSSEAGTTLDTALKKGYKGLKAIKETAAYRLRKRFGFTRIVAGSITKNYGFAMTRASRKTREISSPEERPPQLRN